MPSTWGPAISTKDQSLYMQGDRIIDEPVFLENTGVSDMAKNEIDPVFHGETRRVGGRNRTFEKTLRAAEVTRYTVNVMFNGDLWTPLKEYAQRGGCETTLYIIPNCAQREYKRASVLREVVLREPIETTATIDVGTDASAITEQSEADFVERFWLWNLKHEIVRTFSDYGYAMTIREEDCVDCAKSPFQSFVVLTSDGTAFDTQITDDRFGTVTTRTALGAAAPAGSVPTSVFAKDEVIIATFRNAAGATGGTVISNNRGLTATVDSDITAAVHQAGEFDGQYLAVGGATGGQAMVWLSNDGIAWTSVTNGLLPADKNLRAFDVDYSNDTIYAVGEEGLVIKASRASANSLIMAALTPPNITTEDLFAVRVFGPDHVAIAGEGGYYAETLDGGATWVQPAVTTTSDLEVLTGDAYRSAYAGGTTISLRDVLTKNRYANGALESGMTIAGNLIDGVSYNVDRNYFGFLTSTGQVIVSRSFKPGA